MAPMGRARRAMLVDVTRCIGCRACQVACKEWNDLPSEETAVGTGYTNPPSLSGETWKQVKFIDRAHEDVWPAWQFYSDSCKHCTQAPCLDACPTGAIHRTDEGFVLIDDSVCNGNKHCVPACPFHVIDVSRSRGVAQKCTFCYDRVREGLAPACAKVCPTDCIQFGDREALVAAAHARVAHLEADGRDGVHVYGEDLLGGLGVLYVLPSDPEVYGLPDPEAFERPVARLPRAWLALGVTAALWWVVLSSLFGAFDGL